MFGTLFASLKADNSNEQATARRKYTRRDCDKCVTEINGQIYPVENWSLGGFLIAADERAFGVREDVQTVMKFKLRDSIIDVPHKAHVVRKSKNKIAFEFEPISRVTRDRFQRVVDDYVTSQFANSHLA